MARIISGKDKKKMDDSIEFVSNVRVEINVEGCSTMSSETMDDERQHVLEGMLKKIAREKGAQFIFVIEQGRTLEEQFIEADLYKSV